MNALKGSFRRENISDGKMFVECILERNRGIRKRYKGIYAYSAPRTSLKGSFHVSNCIDGHLCYNQERKPKKGQ